MKQKKTDVVYIPALSKVFLVGGFFGDVKSSKLQPKHLMKRLKLGVRLGTQCFDRLTHAHFQRRPVLRFFNAGLMTHMKYTRYTAACDCNKGLAHLKDPSC